MDRVTVRGGGGLQGGLEEVIVRSSSWAAPLQETHGAEGWAPGVAGDTDREGGAVGTPSAEGETTA